MHLILFLKDIQIRLGRDCSVDPSERDRMQNPSRLKLTLVEDESVSFTVAVWCTFKTRICEWRKLLGDFVTYGGVLVYAYASSPAWHRRSTFNDRDLLLSDGGVSNRYLDTYM